MLKLPILLAEINSKFLETTENHRTWNHNNPFRGVQVSANPQHHLTELTVSCYITLPDLTETTGVEHDDVLHLLTIAKGQPGDKKASRAPLLRDSARLREERGGIYLAVTYDPRRSVFEIRKNVGGKSSDLVGVTLEGAAPELVCGRVLELYVEINQDRISAWVHDRFAGGNLLLKAIGPWSGPDTALDLKEAWQPWTASPAGSWWVMSGLNLTDLPISVLPVGLGLSNLRVVLAARGEEAVGSLLYQGALDHLVSSDQAGMASEVALTLARHRKNLRLIATDLERLRLLLPISNPSKAAKALEKAAAKVHKAANAKALSPAR